MLHQVADVFSTWSWIIVLTALITVMRSRNEVVRWAMTVVIIGLLISRSAFKHEGWGWTGFYIALAVIGLPLGAYWDHRKRRRAQT